MKIVEMHIYGYGQLENVIIHHIADFQVFYGENEAGKSTIMAFIHGILFGFPTKQQSSELRYEPKNNAKYGGKIIIDHEEHGLCVIERIKGKASGDVKVVLQNGTIGGEELLKDLLSNFDKGLYQAIFSFNVHGLQNIHQMKGEEIGKFLFSAGTLGTERLAQTESLLQKELETRFKPGGKKPILNEKLHSLHELSGKLKKASAKNQELTSLIEQSETLQNEMTEINDSLKDVQEEAEKLTEWKKINHFVKEEKWLKKEMEELGDIHFPALGLERLEKLNQLFHPYNAQINGLVERIEGVKKDIATINPNLSLLENEEGVSTILERVPLNDQLKLEAQQCELKLKEFEEKLSIIKEKLHLALIDEEIMTINTSIYMKDQVEKTARKSHKLAEVKQELEERFLEEKNALENLEKEVQFAEGQVLSELEREALEKQVFGGNDKKSLEFEMDAIKDKLVFYQHTSEQNKKQQKQKQRLFYLLFLFLLGITAYSLLSTQWILFILGVICLVAMGVLIINGMRPKNDHTQQTLKKLKENEKQISEKLQSAEIQNMTALEERLRTDNQRREQLQTLQIKLEQQQIQYEKIISKFEEWELESSRHKDKLREISNELRLPIGIVDSYLSEAFQMLEQYKILGRDHNHLMERLQQINLEQEILTTNLESYAMQFLPEKGLNLHKTAYLLRVMLKEEHEKQIKSREKQMKLVELEADLEQKKQEQQHLHREIHKLLAEANTQDETAFYELGRNANQLKKLNDKLTNIQIQLQYSLLSESERERFLQIHNIDERINKYHHQEQFFHDRLKKLHEELAAVNYEIQVLEEGGAYSDLLHQVKQKKFEFDQAAKEWAAYRLAEDILQKTIEKFKNVHLPRMLSKAEEYLRFLTEGNYQKIHLQSSGTGFLIERKDHTIFEANELSQATTEQVYVSIRFALATTLYEKYRFPIIIDDSFVNFDKKRTQNVMELLKSMEGNQILFFTCHSHLLKYFQNEKLICLEKGSLQIS